MRRYWDGSKDQQAEEKKLNVVAAALRNGTVEKQCWRFSIDAKAYVAELRDGTVGMWMRA